MCQTENKQTLRIFDVFVLKFINLIYMGIGKWYTCSIGLNSIKTLIFWDVSHSKIYVETIVKA